MELLFRFTLILGFFIFPFEECFAAIPSDIQKCHSADVVCIAKTTTMILHNNPNGNPELGLRKIEPFFLKGIEVARTHGNTPLNLNFKFTNVYIFGLSKTNVYKVVGFEKDPKKSKFEIYVTIPELRISGNYETNGRILLLPIVGNGTADIKLKNLKSGVKIKLATIVDENGKETVTISKIKVQVDPESVNVRLDNLFNGNKALGDELNKVINDNWRDVWTELESGINDAYSDVIKLLLREVLKVVVYDEFYID